MMRIVNGLGASRGGQDLREVRGPGVGGEDRLGGLGGVVEGDLVVGAVEVEGGVGGLHDSNYREGGGKRRSVLSKSSSASLSSRTGKFHHATPNPCLFLYASPSPANIIMGRHLMIKSLPLILLLLPLTCCSWQPTWAPYHWPARPSLRPTGNQIVLTHPSHSAYVRVDCGIHIDQIFNGYNTSEYRVGQSGKIRVIASNNELLLQLSGIEGDTNIEIGCHESPCPAETVQLISGSVKTIRQSKDSVEMCTWSSGSQPHAYTIKCPPLGSQNPKEPTIHIHQLNKTLTVSDLAGQENKFEARAHKFMTAYNASTNNDTQHLQIFKSALSALLNSISVYEEDGLRYLGFCDQDTQEYNFKLAALPIELLASYEPSLGMAIFKDYSTLIENRVMYPLEEDNRKGLPLPEHIEVFSLYAETHRPLREAEIMNSLFVMPMLGQLGTLHEEVNYRQQKKLHPHLMEMLAQKWKSRSQLEARKSLYAESFTEDFKHHEYGDLLEQSIAKNAWMYKLIDTYTTILARYYSAFMSVEQIKEHMREHFTLLGIIRSFISEDENSKAGRYVDIVLSSNNVKYYSKYYGYGSILPYIYRASSVFPAESFQALSSPFGLKSSNQDQYEGSRRYRGDIHAYFNYKILSSLSERVASLASKNDQKLLKQVDALGKNAAAFIEAGFKENKTIYTSWSPSGQGKEQVEWLKIVSALMLKWAQ